MPFPTLVIAGLDPTTQSGTGMLAAPWTPVSSTGVTKLLPEEHDHVR